MSQFPPLCSKIHYDGVHTSCLPLPINALLCTVPLTHYLCTYYLYIHIKQTTKPIAHPLCFLYQHIPLAIQILHTYTQTEEVEFMCIHIPLRLLQLSSMHIAIWNESHVHFLCWSGTYTRQISDGYIHVHHHPHHYPHHHSH